MSYLDVMPPGPDTRATKPRHRSPTASGLDCHNQAAPPAPTASTSHLPRSEWRTVRAAVLERDGHTCQIKRAKCRTLATEVDDIRPVSDRGVPVRDVQLAARHADPRTTTTNDRRRENFGRHAAYVVVAFIAGT